MAHLALFDREIHRKIGSAPIDKIFESKIFYLFRGRNAWHSTWVTHYFDGCMHDQLPSTKGRAEQRRERGSVFTIREQPALVLQSRHGLVAITEINSACPLSHWIKKYRNEKSGYRLNQDYCRLEAQSRPGCTTTAMIDAMSDVAIFPTQLPWRSKNFFILATPDPEALREDRRTRLKQWGSSSAGAYYYLDWNETSSHLSGKAVRRVADALAPRIHNSSMQQPRDGHISAQL